MLIPLLSHMLAALVSHILTRILGKPKCQCGSNSNPAPTHANNKSITETAMQTSQQQQQQQQQQQKQQRPALTLSRQYSIAHPQIVEYPQPQVEQLTLTQTLPQTQPKKKRKKKKKNKKEERREIREDEYEEKEKEKEKNQLKSKDKPKDKPEDKPQPVYELVMEELSLLSSYYLHELEEVFPYNGRYGEYKLRLQGTFHQLTLSWKYNQSYPSTLIHPSITGGITQMKPVQLQKLSQIINLHQEKWQASHGKYLYIWQVSVAIYQEILMVLQQEDTAEGEKERREKEKQKEKLRQKEKENKNDKKTTGGIPHYKKEIYNEILDEIFYMHDLQEQPEISQFQETSKGSKYHNPRGRYAAEFEELLMIGEGGFGKVYKVKHKLDGNIYAIKKIIINYADPTDRKLLKEVALLSKLNHPNVVRYHQSWLQDLHNLVQLAEDMQYSQESKMHQLKQIWKQWESDREEIKFERGDSSSSSAVEYMGDDDIMFQEDNMSDIIFAADTSIRSEIKSSSRKRDGKGNGKGDKPKHDMDESDISMDESGRGKIQEEEAEDESGSEPSVFPFKILYIAMEFCNGINLREFINTRFTEEESKTQIVRGILEGLAYIHDKHIIHRDLKPANIFLTGNNKVKIGDFGLATTEEKSLMLSADEHPSSFSLFQHSQNVGTGFYRAPQQFTTSHYNEKLDIYSLGIIMLELYYKFDTGMERMEVLKEVTRTCTPPKDLGARHGVNKDIVENIEGCLKRSPAERWSAAKLLLNFRNKYFTQLVSTIANPKHFQFNQLLSHLFKIRNEWINTMRRDSFKPYPTADVLQIYHMHRGSFFPTLPLLPVYDYVFLNGRRIPVGRSEKFLLLAENGVMMECAANVYAGWGRYLRQAVRRERDRDMEEKERLNEQRRRFTFDKIVEYVGGTGKKDQYAFRYRCILQQVHKMFKNRERFVTAFDLAYNYEEGFKGLPFVEVMIMAESIIPTLQLTQKSPPFYICHSHLFLLLANLYCTPVDSLYAALLSRSQEKFISLSAPAQLSHLQSFGVPSPLAKKIIQNKPKVFEECMYPLELQLDGQMITTLIGDEDEFKDEYRYEIEVWFREYYHRMREQMEEIERMGKKYVGLPIRWKLQLPPASTNGLFFQVGPIKSFTSIEEVEEYTPICNIHLTFYPPSSPLPLPDLSITSINPNLTGEVFGYACECWKQGVSAVWNDGGQRGGGGCGWGQGRADSLNENLTLYNTKIGRNSLCIKRKGGRLMLMLRKEGGDKEEKWRNEQAFDKQVLKSLAKRH